MKIHLIVTGFGAPHVEQKLQILENNLARLAQSKHHTFRVTVYVYDDTVLPESRIHHIIRGPGIVGQFIYAIQPETQADPFDYVWLILDDVEILFNVDEFLEQVTSTTAICQPSLSHDSMYSHESMIMRHAAHDKDVWTAPCTERKPFEYFCYVMTPSLFRTYQSLFDENTKNMWGLDYVLFRYVNCVLFRDFKIRHYFKGGLDRVCGTQAMYQEMYQTMARLTSAPNHDSSNI